MNKLSTKILLCIVVALIILGGIYLYNKRSVNHNQAQTPPPAQTNSVVTPEQLATQDILKANVTYRDAQSGYEFKTFEDMSYTRVEIEKERRITLSSDTGHNSTTTNDWIGWPIIDIGGAVAFTANNKLPANYDLLTEVKKYYVPSENTDPFPSQPNCEINNIQCVKITSRPYPGGYATQEIYLVTQGYLLRIHLNDTSTKEARDYYDKFLSSFKIVSGTN
jgi:hypothetical protein